MSVDRELRRLRDLVGPCDPGIAWKSNPAILAIIEDAVRQHPGRPDLAARAVVNELNRGFYAIIPAPMPDSAERKMT